MQESMNHHHKAQLMWGVSTTMSIDDGFGFGEKGVLVDLASNKQYRRQSSPRFRPSEGKTLLLLT
jgi:hypothetical protein